MVELREIYKCEVCGNIVEVLHSGSGKLVCCGKEMVLIEEQFEGEYAEKHSPVIDEREDGTIVVSVGKVEHPMEKEHYIEWIELIVDGKSHREFLKPEEKPRAEFCVPDLSGNPKMEARMYCNVHGLWKG